MVFSGIEQMGELPFKDVYITGLVRDEFGKKMSKSAGNGIDPLDVIDKYGTDALRMTMITGNAPGNDIRFNLNKTEASRNFINKIWNATRFIMMNIDEGDSISPDKKTAADKWILSRMNGLVKEVTNNLETYELGVALQNINDFAWDEFCDWYIEMVKPRLYNKDDSTRGAALHTLKETLITVLKLLHPFAPFVTEEIFLTLQSDEETIMLSKWPEFNENLVFKKEEDEIEMVKSAIKSIRNIRAEMNVPPSKKAKIFIVSESEDVRSAFTNQSVFLYSLASASDIAVQADAKGIAENAVSIVIPSGMIYMPFEELIDIEKEVKRLEAERDKFESEINRAVKKLANEGFIAKAPESLINEEKAKIEKYKDMLQKTIEQIDKFTAK
jgi:valyl-tRNA synthetase